MNIMWMPLQPLISSPPFSGSRARPINPSPEVMKLRATSSGSATIVPSCLVSRKTLSPYYTALCAMGRWTPPRRYLFVLKRVDDDDDRWAHQDDEQGREDAADHREEHFQRSLRGLLFRPLTAAAPHLFRLDAEYFRDTDTELFRLDQRLDEGVQLLDAGAAAHVIERLQARPAEPDLVEHLRELVGERVLELFREPPDGGVEAEAGLDRDGQQVERVRQRQTQLFLPSLDLVVEPDVGEETAEHEAEAERRALERKARDPHYPGQTQGHQGDDDADDHLDDLEAVDTQRVGPAGEVDLVLDDDLAVLRHAGGEQAAQPLQHRLDEALAERQRELDFVQRQVVVAILRQPFRDEVLPGFGCNGLHRDDDAAEGQEGEDETENNTHSLHLDVRDFRDDAVADRDRDEAHTDQDVTQPFVEERRDVGRRDEGQDQREREGQTRDDVARGASLRGQGTDLALDADPFPDGEGDGVENLGQVATDDPVDLDRRDHQVEVFGFDALH